MKVMCLVQAVCFVQNTLSTQAVLVQIDVLYALPHYDTSSLLYAGVHPEHTA